MESSRLWSGAPDEFETLFEYVDNKTQKRNGQSNRHLLCDELWANCSSNQSQSNTDVEKSLKVRFGIGLMMDLL